MAHGRNPAERLAHFMNDLKPHASSGGGAAEHLATYFGLSWPHDVATLLERLGDVADLASQTRRIAESLPTEASTELQLRYFGQVEQVITNFARVYGLQVRQLLEPMQETGWHSLELASDLLRRHAGEPALQDDTVAGLLDQTKQLIDAVIAAEDLDRELRAWLLAKLRDVRTALENVEITGYFAIERATDSAIGGIRRRPDLIERLTQSRVSKGLITLLTALSLAVGTAEGVSRLTTSSSGPEIFIQQVIPQPVATPALESGSNTQAKPRGSDGKPNR